MRNSIAFKIKIWTCSDKYINMSLLKFGENKNTFREELTQPSIMVSVHGRSLVIKSS